MGRETVIGNVQGVLSGNPSVPELPDVAGGGQRRAGILDSNKQREDSLLVELITRKPTRGPRVQSVGTWRRGP